MADLKVSAESAAAALDGTEQTRIVQGGASKRTTINEIVGRAPIVKPRAVVQLIHDTDLGDDCDDVGAFAVMHRLADLGECEILACGFAPSFTYGARAIAALNTYYGRAHIPIGVSKSGGYSAGGHSNYGAFLAAYPSPLDPSANVEEAYVLYRRILAGQPDGSVTFMTQGQLTNLAALYNSTADSYSPLTGADLMLAKCSKVVILAGTYPGSSGSPEFDLSSDATSAQVVNSLAATLPVVWSGSDYGGDVYTNSAAMLGGPVRASFDEFFRVFGGTTRQSWGAMCVMYAVRGLSFGGDTYATLSAQGENVVDSLGNNTFTTGSTKNQYYLIRSLSTSTFASRIMALQDATPAAYTPVVGGGTGGVGLATASYRGPGSGTDLSTTSTSYVAMGSYAVSIPAAVGDVLAIELNGIAYMNSIAGDGYWQFAVNGTAIGPETIISIGASATDLKGVNARARRTVISGDLVSGAVPVTVNWKLDVSGTIKFSDGAAYAGLLTATNLTASSVEHVVSADTTLTSDHAWPNSIRVTGGTSRTITIASGVFRPGRGPKIIADGAAVTVAGSGVTLTLAGGTTTGSRTIANGGIADVYTKDSSNSIVGGPGVT